MHQGDTNVSGTYKGLLDRILGPGLTGSSETETKPSGPSSKAKGAKGEKQAKAPATAVSENPIKPGENTVVREVVEDGDKKILTYDVQFPEGRILPAFARNVTIVRSKAKDTGVFLLPVADALTHVTPAGLPKDKVYIFDDTVIYNGTRALMVPTCSSEAQKMGAQITAGSQGGYWGDKGIRKHLNSHESSGKYGVVVIERSKLSSVLPLIGGHLQTLERQRVDKLIQVPLTLPSNFKDIHKVLADDKKEETPTGQFPGPSTGRSID